MDFLSPPRWLVELFPEGLRSTVEARWPLALGLLALVLLLVAIVVLRLVFRKRTKTYREPDLEEDLSSIPKAPASTGDRRLTVEGVPVRMRLVVLAPAGNQVDVNPAMVNKLLDRVVAGLGAIAAADKPLVRIWPKQMSYEGFANIFHRNTPLPDGEDEPTNWVLVAGRAKLAGNQVMIGLGLQAVKPTTVGRKTLQPHEWDTVFRVKVRE